MGVKLLEAIRLKSLAQGACLWASITIFVCYGLAVAEGHVPLYLPMISACAVSPPESYLFRLGMISSAVLLNLNAFFVLGLMPTITGLDKFAVVASSIGCFGLAGLAAVNEHENNSLHGGMKIATFNHIGP